MDLFFLASKVGWFVLAPSNLIALATISGLALWRWKRTARVGPPVTIGAAIALAVVAFLPVGDLLLRRLEQRFPRYEACPGLPVAGIILLGGGLSSRTVAGRVVEDLGDAADRIRYAATLARENPGLPVLISGGQVFERSGARSEAEGMADLLVELGVDRSRIVMETQSRTTAENAAFANRQAGESGAWLVVTSAFHMPRAMGAFRKAGVNAMGAPTDWLVDDASHFLSFSAAGNLDRFDLAVREYLGLLAYGVTGRTDALIPGPRPGDACPADSP